MSSALRTSGEFLQPAIEMFESRFELLPVAYMSCRFDILENTFAREKQTLPLAFHAELLFRSRNRMFEAPGFGGLHLRLD